MRGLDITVTYAYGFLLMESVVALAADGGALYPARCDSCHGDKIGSFMSRQDCERFLNNWISHYVLLDDSASQEAKAQFPLRAARVEVNEVPGKPGGYTATAFLRPHFQLDELTISLRLVLRLPEPRV